MSENLFLKIGKRVGDVSDLPEALRKQIVQAKLDEIEEKVLYTLRERYEGVANVDELMVGLYRDHNYITEDRRVLANKLYRMQRSGLLDSVPKKKGAYQIKQHSMPTAAKTLSPSDEGSDAER